MQRTEGEEKPDQQRVAELDALVSMVALAMGRTGRVVVAGGPRCGKSVLSSKLGVRVRGTDELIGLGWSQASESASLWFDERGPWICEGVAMPRALRKWLVRNATGMPCDLVVWLKSAVVARVSGQEAMAAGCLTVWSGIKEEVVRRGVKVYEF